MSIGVDVERLSKSFGSQSIWSGLDLALPPGQVSVLLRPSGTGKSVFLRSLIGLVRPEKGSIAVGGVDVCRCSDSELYEARKLFGVLFQLPHYSRRCRFGAGGRCTAAFRSWACPDARQEIHLLPRASWWAWPWFDGRFSG